MLTLTNSGPGPQTLIGGDLTLGFFGELSQSELITAAGLFSELGLTQGNLKADTEGWLKFIVDGKVTYVAKRPFYDQISWSHLSLKKAVLGETVKTIQQENYKVRLLKGAPGPAISISGGPVDPPTTYGSEWNRLMYRIVNLPGNSGEGIPYGEWAQYSENDLQVGAIAEAATICQESSIDAPNDALNRGYRRLGAGGKALKTSATALMAWRPVLESTSVVELNIDVQFKDDGGVLANTVDVGFNNYINLDLELNLADAGNNAAGTITLNNDKIGEFGTDNSGLGFVSWYAGDSPTFINNGDVFKAELIQPVPKTTSLTVIRNQPNLEDIVSLAAIVNKLKGIVPDTKDSEVVVAVIGRINEELL